MKTLLTALLLVAFAAVCACEGSPDAQEQPRLTRDLYKDLYKMVPDLLVRFGSNSPKDWEYAHKKLSELVAEKDSAPVHDFHITPDMQELISISLGSSPKSVSARAKLASTGKIFKVLSKYDPKDLAGWPDVTRQMISMGDEAVMMGVETMIGMLRMSQNPVVWETVRSQLVIYDKASIVPLMSVVTSAYADSTTLEQCLTTLIEMGDIAETQLALIADKAEPKIKSALAKSLRNGFGASHMAILTKLASDKEWFVRGEAVTSMAELKLYSFVPSLVAALSDKDAFVQMSSAVALGKMKEPSSVRPLVGLLDTVTDKKLRKAVIEALEAISGAKFGDDGYKWKEWFKSSVYSKKW